MVTLSRRVFRFRIISTEAWERRANGRIRCLYAELHVAHLQRRPCVIALPRTPLELFSRPRGASLLLVSPVDYQSARVGPDSVMKQWSEALLDDHPFRPPRNQPPTLLAFAELFLARQFNLAQLENEDLERWCGMYLVRVLAGALEVDLKRFGEDAKGDVVEVRGRKGVRSFQELGEEALRKLEERWGWKRRD